jgi:WD40 repeat protein
VVPGRCPADAWRREQIPPHELRAAGGGDAGKAPAELVAVFGDSRLKTGSWSLCAAISPDGKTVAAGCEDGTIKVWDAATGEERHTLRGHQSPVTSLAIGPDGAVLASGGSGPPDCTIKLWDVAAGKLLATLPGHGGHVGWLSFSFSPDGKTLASGSDDQTAKVWEVTTGRLLHTLRGSCVHFSRDGRKLATTLEDATVMFWDAATGEPAGSWPRRTNMPVPAFSPDLKTLTTQPAERPGVLELIDVATGAVRQAFPGHQGGAKGAAFTADGRTLATRDGPGHFRLWDVATGKALPGPPGGPGYHGAPLGFSRDGTLLAAPGAERLWLWDVVKREERFPSGSHWGALGAVAFSPDGRTLVTGAWNRSIRWWDVATGAEKCTLTGHADYVIELAYSPDGGTLASASYDGTIKLWRRKPLTIPVGRFLVGRLAWSPDGKTLASGLGGGTARLWDAATGELRQELPGHADPIRSVSFSPDGKLLAVADGGDRTTVYRREPVEAVATVKGSCAAFSPEGKTLATASAGVVTLRDVATNREVKRFPPLPGAPEILAFSPDGRWLAGCHSDEQSTLMLWRVRDDNPRPVTLKVPTWVRGLAFSPEGRHLATANGTNTVYLFRLAPPPP